MKTKHTPGPWGYEPNRGHPNKSSYEIVTPDCWLANVYFGNGMHPDRLPEVEANARLIATAPELLAACKSADTEWTLHHSIVDTIRDIRAVIARATTERGEGRPTTNL